MKKLLTSPVKMALSDAENVIYQNILKHATELSLNLMAVKVENRPEDFLGWCYELHRLCHEGINFDLMEPEQFAPLRKMQELLEKGVSLNQLKMLRITPWPVFTQFISQNEDSLALEERFKLLAHLNSVCDAPLQQMNELDLLALVGKHTQQHDPGVYNFDVEWFGSTKGAKLFQQLILEHTFEFNAALEHIPLNGDVTKSDYDKFVAAYIKIFSNYAVVNDSNDKAPLAPATRLLAMRRPDLFIAITNNKLDVLCQAFMLAKVTPFDFNGYWDEIIVTLQNMPWWKQNEPESEEEKLIWKHRALFVDLFFFADKNTPSQSNYLRLKDKFENKPAPRAGRAPARKRTKETAEAIVDKRLADPDVPEYLLGKRDSLVTEVKNGKTVDQAIQLFRAIFG